MNKLLTKIVGIALGATMAIGVGVAVASNRDAVPVHADEEPYYTLDGTTTIGTDSPYNSYSSASETTAEQTNSIKWGIEANTTMSPWRIGGKHTTATDRKISSRDPIPVQISSVEMNCPSLIAAKKTIFQVDQITLHVYETYDSEGGTYSDLVDTVTVLDSSISATSSGNSAVTTTISDPFVFEPTSGDYWSDDLYYVFAINCKATNNGALNNSYLQLNNIKFYEHVDIAATINGSNSVNVGTQWAPTNITEDVGGAIVTGATYSFATSNGAHISSSNTSTGAFTCDAAGTVTVSATKTGYAIASKAVTVNSLDPYINLILTSDASTYTGKTVSITSEYGNGVAGLTWSVQSGSISGTATKADNTGYTAKISNTAGTLTIRATDTGSETYSEVSVTVTKTAFTTSPSASTSVSVGQTTTLTAALNSEGTINWSSDATDVATVSAGVVTGVAEGTATITAQSADDTTVSASCTVTVIKAPASIYFGNADGSTKINSTSVTGKDSDNNTWTVTCADTPGYAQNTSYSQVGTSSKPTSAVTFTTTLSTTVYVSSFSAKFGAFSGDEGTITLKIGDKTVGTGSLNGTTDVTVSANVFTIGKTLTIEVTDMTRLKAYYISFASTSANNIVDDCFVNQYLHMSDYDPNLDTKGQEVVSPYGQCSTYYPIAKAAWNNLSTTQRSYFIDNSDEGETYHDAYERLVAWAAANGEALNGSNVLASARIDFFASNFGGETSAATIIVIVSLIGLTAIGGYFFLRKRKEVK